MRGFLREIRMQHGREHATVSVLLERGARLPLGGNATPGGFFIYGRASTKEVRDAAEEALARLQTGQGHLAVSPYCGTNILAGAFIALAVSWILQGRSKSIASRLGSSMVGVMVGLTLSRRVGAFVQRRFTTLPDSNGVSVRAVKGVRIGKMTIHWVSTTARRTA